MKKNIIHEVLQQEAQALFDAAQRILEEAIDPTSFFEHLRFHQGKLLVLGVGKSGIIAQKIAATFSSLGQPAFALHPTEMQHGDLGGVQEQDSLILISKSGETAELLEVLPYLNIPRERTIVLVGNPQSTLSRSGKYVFDCSIKSEACINNQAPTTSTTLTLAMGDALAVFYQNFAQVTPQVFGKNHPAGSLGKSLYLKVEQVMLIPEQCSFVSRETTLREVLMKMTEYPVGICFVGDKKQVEGIIVEGDIRRALVHQGYDMERPAHEFMSQEFTQISESAFALDALKKMKKENGQTLSVLPVMKGQEVLGIVRYYDLLKEGLS